MADRYICNLCDMYKKKGCLTTNQLFQCSDCDKTFWREKNKWSQNGFIYQK